jgi:hypothetical protein
MCLNLRHFFSCRHNSAYLSCRDNLLPGEILINLFCPQCRPEQVVEDNMLQDCGWVLEYDVERARAFFALQEIKSPATPAFIFDEGYLSWQGLAPEDQGSIPGCISVWRPSLSRTWPFTSNHYVLNG